jgi:hypothetical protein
VDYLKVPAEVSDEGRIHESMKVVYQGTHLHEIYQAYVLLGYFYSVAKDKVRRSKRGTEDYLKSKHNEEVLEGFVKAAPEALALLKHLNNHERNG